MRKRRTTITVETRRVLMISRRTRDVGSWCNECGKRVERISQEGAASACALDVQDIQRDGIEAGQLHFIETPGGSFLICLSSFLKWITAGFENPGQDSSMKS
jgi:hypothetical protein